MRERIEALYQPLRIVEPVDADDQSAAGEADPKALEFPAALGHGRGALDIPGVDADRMSLDREDPPERANDCASLPLLHPRFRLADQIVEKVSAVRLRLEADKVEGGEATHELFVHRQGSQELPWRQRCVQKEAQPVPNSQPAQFLAERNQVVVVDPDQVVRPQQAGQPAGEPRVDAPIAGVIAAVEVDEIDAVMKERPERRVSELVVVSLVVAFAEIHGGAGQPSALGYRYRFVGFGDHLAAPAEPDAA